MDKAMDTQKQTDPGDKFKSGWYMASSGSIPEKYDDTLGIIYTMNQNGRYKKRHDRAPSIPWCLDNGVYTNKFNFDEWIKRIEYLNNLYHNTCLFIVMPDVIGDAISTLMQFKVYRDIVYKYDLPVALVSQDGIKSNADLILWDELDCIFIGGSDEHKLGREGGWILSEAKKRGKWVHVGRVNSRKRILKFWQADSWDGNDLTFNPKKRNLDNYRSTISEVRNMKRTKGLFDGLHNFVPYSDSSG